MSNSGFGNQQDLAAMKKLLTSWHVEILYDLFKEEDISIEELKMMQTAHINSLLKNYKMGVRIRFEHHFNNWRTKIGIPLKLDEVPYHSKSSCCCNYNRNISNGPTLEYNTNITQQPYSRNHENDLTITTVSNAKRKRQNDEDIDHTEMEDTQGPFSPHSVKSDNSFNQKVSPMEVLNLPSANDSRSQDQQTNDNEDEIETDNLALDALNDLFAVINKEKPPKFPSKPTHDRCPVNLAQILQLSGARALSIVKFYKEKKHLTNIHRTQLIQLIVEFFDQNDYHLSLNASHNLEWEILKMFPNEKLEYYRTEKRGKIYVKYSNMKRYKRERNIKVNNELESINMRLRRSHQQIDDSKHDGMMNDDGVDVETENYDEWPVMPEPEIEVKEERLSDSL